MRRRKPRSQRQRGEDDIERERMTDEDEEDRAQRGLRGDYDNRALQFVSHTAGTDDLRGQFRRSRDDGELGRRGDVISTPTVSRARERGA
jgi:hypothetical protein